MKKFILLLALLGCTIAKNRLNVFEAENFCKDKVLNANYNNPMDCSSYISCDDSGKAYIMKCPEGLHYTEDDRPWGHCTDPETAKCQDNPNPIDPDPVDCADQKCPWGKCCKGFKCVGHLWYKKCKKE